MTNNSRSGRGCEQNRSRPLRYNIDRISSTIDLLDDTNCAFLRGKGDLVS